MANSLFKVLVSVVVAAAFIAATVRYNQKQAHVRVTTRTLLRVKSPFSASTTSTPSSSSSSVAPALPLERLLQVGAVQGGGGGTANLFYSAAVSAVNPLSSKIATASAEGTGTVMGKGSGSIRGPNGMAAAGGSGGGNITSGFNLSAFKGGFGVAKGGGGVTGFGGGSGQFFPGMNAAAAQGLDTSANRPSTGGGGTAGAFALGSGAGNLTATITGAYAGGNATGTTSAFGIGYGQGSNSDGIAGGNAVSFANGVGGGVGAAGGAPAGTVLVPIAGIEPSGFAGFVGIGGGASLNTAGGYIGGNNPKVSTTPYVPTFKIPTFPANNTLGFGVVAP